MSRTCCASRRRRSSARSFAGTATSTPPRTRFRRRSSRPRSTGRGTGIPESPRGWLLQSAERRLIDQWRSEQSRRNRESVASQELQPPEISDRDDTLIVLFMCCHPALTPASAIALTLRAVGGLTTAEIAKAFLVGEATMAQRIARAKQQVKASGVPFRMPTPDEQPARLSTVLHVLYLIFNEGYASSSGSDVHRTELSDEAIRLTRIVHAALPDDGEVAGLLALMLLIDARRPARTDAAGELVPLAEQDRALWDRGRIVEGTALLDGVVGKGPVGEYQLQAAIAAVHDRALHADETDWPQILALYGLLEGMTGQSHRHAQPRRRGRDGRRPRRRARGARRGRRTPDAVTTAWTRSARISWSWPATARPRSCTIAPPPPGRRACRSSATWRRGRRGSRAPCDRCRSRSAAFVVMARPDIRREGATMKYLLLVCWDAERMDAQTEPDPTDTPEEEEGFPWLDDLQAKGSWITGDQLAPPRRARSVRVRGGKAIVTDGPFAETKEAVGGFDLIEASSLEEAVEIAAGHPVAQSGTIEVRPLWGN